MSTITFKSNNKAGDLITVDEADWPVVSKFRWWACRRRGSFTRYAQTAVVVDGKKTMMYLHRLLMDPKPGEVVDHIDGDALNNTRENLRIVSQSENQKAARSLPGRYAQPRKEEQRQVIHMRLKSGEVRVYVYDRKTRKRLDPEPSEYINGKTRGKTRKIQDR